MDFLDPKKARAHEIRLFIGYILMGIALFLVTVILFFQATGFDLDRKTGAIIQNGIVFVDAHPEPATIYLNGQNKGQTDNRLVLPAGPYDIELRRDGYRAWKRSFNLVGSTIERLVYPFLFPEKLTTNDIRTYDVAPGIALQSPDRRWLLVQQPNSLNTFTVTDLNDQENNATTTVNVPAEVLTPGPGTNKLELVEWSTDNRRVLVKHTFEGGMAFVVIDREVPAESVNLTRVFAATPFDAIRLRDKKFDQYYLHNTASGQLLTADLRVRTPTLLAAGVLAFQPHGDDEMLYVTNEGAPEGRVFVRIRSGSDAYTISEEAAAPKYLLDLARFDDEWYMAVGAINDPRIHIYKEAFADVRGNPTTPPHAYSTLRLDNPEFLSFSANTRFIGVQSGSKFAVFDAETDRQYKFDSKLPLAAGQKATWMDGHRYALVSENKLYVFDFDGTNPQQLVGMNPAYLPYFDRDYDFLYTMSPSVANPSVMALAKTSMRTEADQ